MSYISRIFLLCNVLYVGDASKNKVSIAKIIRKCSQLRNPRPFPQVSAIEDYYLLLSANAECISHPCA